MKNNIKKTIAVSLLPLTMSGIAIGELAASNATMANTTVRANYTVANTSQLNIRSGPSTRYGVAGVARRGQVFTGIITNGWLKVTSGSYTGRYLSTNYLSRTTANASTSSNVQSSTGTVFSNTPKYSVAAGSAVIKNSPSNVSATSGSVVKDSLISGRNIGNGWVRIDSGMYNGKYASVNSLRSISNGKFSDSAGTPTLTLSQAESNLRNRIISVAATQYGKPYRWGVSDPNVGFDCSGLSSWVYKQVGISIPRTSYQQAPASTRKTAATAKLGDLVFLHDASGHVYHVGILLNAANKTYWNAPSPGSFVKTGSYAYTNNVYYGSFIR